MVTVGFTVIPFRFQLSSSSSQDQEMDLKFQSVQPLESSTATPWNGTSSPLTTTPWNGTSTPLLSKSGFGYPQYYSFLYKIVGCSFVSVIFCVGFLGNLMVVYVVWRSRSMRTTTNCYLVSLAVADVLLLVSAPLPTIVEYFLIIDESLWGAGGCSVMVFFQYLGVNLSSLSITAFTVERYIAICHPIRAQTLCTIKRARRIISCLWVFGLFYCAPWLGLATVRQRIFVDGTTIDHCDFRLERRHYLTYYVADLIIFYVVPLMLTCVLYGLIARILYRSSSSSFGTAGRVSKVGGFNHDVLTSNKNHCRMSASVVSKHNAAVSSRIQVTKMLAVVVCAFAVLWLPYRAYVVYNSFARQRFEDVWFLLFCRLMVYMNSAINPILYNAMSIKFRRAFRRLLCCGKNGDKKSHIYTQYSHATGHEVAVVD